MTKIEAITHLEKALAYNPLYKKKWADYMELVVLEELENHKVVITKTKEKKLVKAISAHLLRLLFSADWWEAQQLNDKQNENS